MSKVQEIIPGQSYPDDIQVRVSRPDSGDSRNVFRGHEFVGSTRRMTCEYGHAWYRAQLPHHFTLEHPVAPALPGRLACPFEPGTLHNGGFATMDDAAKALADQS